MVDVQHYAMKSKYIIGNWKMHGDAVLAESLANAVSAYVAEHGSWAHIVLCPPFLWLERVAERVGDRAIAVGAQDCHIEKKGAYTGDISAEMIRSTGGAYVIVGHSERRVQHKEENATVAAKAKAALQAGLTPIICIGESLEERESERHMEVITHQLQGSIPKNVNLGKIILAYEPVWAIGTGKIPTIQDISAMHCHILNQVGKEVAVLYGGSVKAANAAEIMAIPTVSGVLVGGASLKAEEFCGIVTAAKEIVAV